MRRCAGIAVALLLAGCGGSRNGAVAPVAPIALAADRVAETAGRPADGSFANELRRHVKHVIVVVQENRTFDNVFHGFPGADTTDTGRAHDGSTVPLQPIPFEQYFDPAHGHSNWETEYDGGKMDGFDLDPSYPAAPSRTALYGYVEPAETAPYFALAHEFTLADRMFASHTGSSYAGHQYLIAAQSDRVIGNPNDPLGRWGCDAQPGTTSEQLQPDGTDIVAGPYPCFDYATLGDSLDRAGRSWRYYANVGTRSGTVEILPTPYDAIRRIRLGSDWTHDVVDGPPRILTDIATRNLADVSWVNPPFFASDHPQSNLDLGPAWVASIANAVAASPYWDDTAILVTWDDWGGWYDHVAPPQLDVMGLGFRVPLMVVSKWAKRGYVSHAQHEYGSLVHFIEAAQNLGTLGTTDQRADDLHDCFDFTNSRPPAYVHVDVPVSASTFLNLPPAPGPIDPY